MKLHRPHIPLSVRVCVIERQLREQVDSLRERNDFIRALCNERLIDAAVKFGSNSYKLRVLTGLAFREQIPHLDHDPALCNRQYNPKTKTYTPDANDPKYLVYRTKAEHDIKTRVRGDGALRSDLAQRRYLKKVAKNRSEKRSRSKWPKRKIANRKAKWPKRSFRGK